MIPRLLLLAALCTAPALALCAEQPVGGQAPNTAADPAVEARLQRLAEELRCLVCQNETLAGSHADLAIDLKNQIREKIKAGQSDRDIIDYLVARYGDFVLYRPPLKAATIALWAGPFVLLLLGLALMIRQLKRRARGAQHTAAPTQAELAHAQQLLAAADQARSPTQRP